MTIVNRSTGRRRAQAIATREHIIATAEKLFAENGYSNTTIESIAATAEVAVQTIYNCLGSKSAILTAVIARSTADADDLATICRRIRQDATASRASADLVKQFADWVAAANRRSMTTLDLLDQAAAVDQKVRRRDGQDIRESLKHFALIAASVRSSGGTSSLSDKLAAEAIHAVAHPKIYRELVVQGSQTHTSYRLWLEATLRQLLL